jgi:integrase
MGKLTAAGVRGLKAPGKYYDQHGLILRVAPGGSKQWVWRGTIRGRRRDLGLGSVTYRTLAEARDLAYEYRKIARDGGDPTLMRRGNSVPTFAEASELVIQAHRGGWKDGGRSEDNWRSSLQRYAYPHVGTVPVDAITTADLVRILLPIWHTKRETARKVKTRVGVVMRWAIAEGHRRDDPAGPPLAAALPRYSGSPGQHFASLPHDELASVFAKLDSAPETWRPTVACLWFVAATVARSAEARLAVWEEFDLGARTWTVPGGRTKTGRQHVVPLSPVAMAALDEARAYANGSGLVFPSPKGRTLTSGSLSRFTRLEGFTPHGLRASFRTWCAETGVRREVAEAALAHTAGAVERAYQRSDLLAARRELMDDWAKVLIAAPPDSRLTGRGPLLAFLGDKSRANAPFKVS